MKEEWKRMLKAYQDEYWETVNREMIFVMEFYIANVQLRKEVLSWLPDPEGKMRIRIKFYDIPCVEIRGTFEDKPQNPPRANHNFYKTRISKIMQESSMSLVTAAAPVSEKGFDPTRCMAKDNPEPPVPKVHKLPGWAKHLDDPTISDTESEKDSPYSDCTSDENRKKNRKRKASGGSNVATAGTGPLQSTKSVPFNDGRTLVFNKSPGEVMFALTSAPLAVNVFIPGPILIGRCLIPMYQFAEAIIVALNSPRNIPTSGVLDGTFDLFNQGRFVGTVDLDLRLTCYGTYVVHPLLIEGNKNDKRKSTTVETTVSGATDPALHVVKLKVREDPLTPKMERLFKMGRTTEKVYPPVLRATTIVPPIVFCDSFDSEDTHEYKKQPNEKEKTEQRNLDEKDKSDDKPFKPKGFHYKCTDWETIVNRKTLEDLIRMERRPFHKGSPYREMICPAYLSKKQLTMYESEECIEPDSATCLCPQGQEAAQNFFRSQQGPIPDTNQYKLGYPGLDYGEDFNWKIQPGQTQFDPSQFDPTQQSQFASTAPPTGYGMMPNPKSVPCMYMNECACHVNVPPPPKLPDNLFSMKCDKKDPIADLQKKFDLYTSNLDTVQNKKAPEPCPCPMYRGRDIKKIMEHRSKPIAGQPAAYRVTDRPRKGPTCQMTYMEMLPHLPTLLDIVRIMGEVGMSFGYRSFPEEYVPYVGMLPYIGVLLLMQDLKQCAEASMKCLGMDPQCYEKCWDQLMGKTDSKPKHPLFQINNPTIRPELTCEQQLALKENINRWYLFLEQVKNLKQPVYQYGSGAEVWLSYGARNEMEVSLGQREQIKKKCQCWDNNLTAPLEPQSVFKRNQGKWQCIPVQK